MYAHVYVYIMTIMIAMVVIHVRIRPSTTLDSLHDVGLVHVVRDVVMRMCCTACWGQGDVRSRLTHPLVYPRWQP